MAKKENTILTIDIGGETLKMAEFTVLPEGGGLRLDSFAVKDYEEELKDSPLNEIFADVFPKMLAENNFVAKNVYISISGQVAFARLSKLPPLADDKGSIRKLVEFEAKQTVPYPMDEVVWDYQLVKHTSLVAESKPEPVEGEELPPEEPIMESVDEMEALFVAVKKDLISDIAELVEDNGKNVVAIEIAPTASYNAAKGVQIGNDGCDMILNIGGRCSSLIFVDHNRVFTRIIPIAGFAVTQQICKEFGITGNVREGEDLKRHHGFVALGGAYEEPESEVAATVSKIARNVMTRLHGEINRTINMWRSQYGGAKPVRLFLSGGGSLMDYTTRFFEEKLRIPVDYLNPFPLVEIGPNVDKEALHDIAPMFSESIGMALRELTHCPVDINLLPDSIRNRRAFQKKHIYFYLSCASIILCLMVFYFGVNQRLQIDKGRVDRAQGAVNTTNKMVDRVQGLKRELDGLKGEYDEANNIIKGRRRIVDIYNEIQKAMPDNMWLTSIRPYNSSGQVTQSAPRNDDPFGNISRGQAAAAPVVSADNDSLELIGHSLVLVKDVQLEPPFMANLKKAPCFSNEENSVGYIDEFFVGERGKNNVTTFKIRVKLKDIIKL